MNEAALIHDSPTDITEGPTSPRPVRKLRPSSTTCATVADLAIAHQHRLQKRASTSALELPATARALDLAAWRHEPHDVIDAGIAAALFVHLDASVRDGAPAGAAFEPQFAASQLCTFDEVECAAALRLLRSELDLDDASPIIALALIERCILATPDHRLLTLANWRAVLATAISLAHKMASDEAPRSREIAVVASVALGEPGLKLGALEAHMSELLGYQLHVSQAAFFRYHTAVRELGQQRVALAYWSALDCGRGADSDAALSRRDSSVAGSLDDPMSSDCDLASDDGLFDDWC